MAKIEDLIGEIADSRLREEIAREVAALKKQKKVDLLDPHNAGLPDAVGKAVGLARYAEKHGDFFDRIELIVVAPNGHIKRLNVNREAIREKVKTVTSTPHLEALFEGQT